MKEKIYNREITDYLLDCNFKPSHAGFKHLSLAIQIMDANENTGDIMEKVAKYFNISTCSVERAMRYAIKNSDWRAETVGGFLSRVHIMRCQNDFKRPTNTTL